MAALLEFDALSSQRAWHVLRLVQRKEMSTEFESLLRILANPIFVRYNRGIEESSESPPQPCEKSFVDAVAHDFAILVLLATRTTLNPDFAAFISNKFALVLEEMRRLNKFPNLFETKEMQQYFSNIASNLFPLVPLLNQVQTRQQEFGKLLGALKSLKIELAAKPEGSENRPWSDWLENSAYPSTTWMSLQQKVPRVGCEMIARRAHHFSVVEGHFNENRLIPNTAESQSLPPPGQGYEHFTWSNLFSVALNDVGYVTGIDHSYEGGVTTVEGIARRAYEFKEYSHRRVIPELVPQRNCPFFRFALAFKKDS